MSTSSPALDASETDRLRDTRVAAPPRVSVVVASIDARATIRSSLSAFLEEVGDQGEVILVDASRDGTAEEVERLFPEVRVLRRPAGWLAPELWRDGLREAVSPLVAFSTAQMVPSSGWLESHRTCLARTGAAAVGGPIEPSTRLSANDRAVYLLRYVNYGFQVAHARGFEPPGDNAIYRREALLGLEDSWTNGFWEVEVHRLLRAQGAKLELASSAVVEFRGGSHLRGMLRQRQLHARHYGAARAGRMRLWQRMARSVAAPIVPAVMLRRIALMLGARKSGFGPWLAALPALGLLLAAWTTGETLGTWFGPPNRERDAVGLKDG